jgi:tryptophanyl-tRNA synthetase
MVVETAERITPGVASMPEAPRRQRVFSGIQPSGNFHLGNYLGAVRNWVDQQPLYDSIFCIVDLHALSLPTSREGLEANIRGLANVLLASGIDPERSILFVQSDVREHSELCWLLSSVTQFGELRRMTQFKDKAGEQQEAVSAALFTYPVLQAGDIVLYDTDLVPVGEDQKQHVEVTRDIAGRFNARYGETFVLPKPDIKAEGARIMGLDDPTKKMSKSSANPASYVALSDDADTIRRKIKRAVTDSGSEVRAGDDKPALTNLLTIFALLSRETIPTVEERYAGRGYGAFKNDLAELVVQTISPIQERLAELEADPDVAARALAAGAERARAHAVPKMALVRERMGLGAPVKV